MQIVCPKCQTSYSVAPTALGSSGRNVRCAKCKEVWLATSEEAVVAHEFAAGEAHAGPAASSDRQHEAAADWNEQTPLVESPPIAHDGSTDHTPQDRPKAERAEAVESDEQPVRRGRFQRPPLTSAGQLAPTKMQFGLSVATAVMAALVVGLVIWRTEVVRLLPQTAAFFKIAGINVNLRNLVFDDVHVATETVNGALVIVIEGAIVSTSFKPVEIPRLRFVVRDDHGTAIHAWNTVLDQAVLQTGEKAQFKSRLASPPPNAHDVIVRFFNRRDIGA